MVRLANATVKTTNWHISSIDPDVEYLIEPLLNSEKLEIGNYAPTVRAIGAAKDERTTDVTWVGTMFVRASLRQTKGILDPDNDNQELEFTFHTKRISKKVELTLCQREIYDKIPNDLLAEITTIIRAESTVSEEDEDDINFSSDSSPETSTDPVKTVMETTTTVESKVEDTGLESEPTPATE